MRALRRFGNQFRDNAGPLKSRLTIKHFCSGTEHHGPKENFHNPGHRYFSALNQAARKKPGTPLVSFNALDPKTRPRAQPDAIRLS
jgi:hypothetical protein